MEVAHWACWKTEIYDGNKEVNEPKVQYNLSSKYETCKFEITSVSSKTWQ